MVDFDKGQGLVPVVIQDDDTDEVLMLAYMNAEALARTLESRQVWFYSRSRRELWHKGATPATTSTSAASSSTATTTRCSSASSRWVLPATPANAPASTATSTAA